MPPRPEARPLLLRNAQIPAGARLLAAAILIGTSGRIEAIDEAIYDSDAREIDLAGAIVVPGFIDAHAHGDAPPRPDFMAADVASTTQGVTTLIVGQDGTSFFPSPSSAIDDLELYFAPINGRWSRAPRPQTFREWLSNYDGCGTSNRAALIPNGNLRLAAVGWSLRKASRSELAFMAARLDHALHQGALGLSTGLDYAPSAYADTDELIQLCKVVARHDRVYVTHMRGYGKNIRLGMDEVIKVGLATGVKLHISHFSGRVQQVIPELEKAQSRGLDITFDSYPYTSSATTLSMLAFPPEAFSEGPSRLLERLADRQGAQRFAQVAEQRLAHRAHMIVLAHASAPAWLEHVGATLADIAAQVGITTGQAAVALLKDSHLDTSVVVNRDTFTSGDSNTIRGHPLQMVGSDGIYVGERPHPRGWATFAKTARDQIDGATGWTWDEFVAHTSRRAADRFGLKDRGRLVRGAVADLAVLGDVAPNATFSAPHRRATGIQLVLVAGIPVCVEGTLTEARPSRGLEAQDS